MEFALGVSLLILVWLVIARVMKKGQIERESRAGAKDFEIDYSSPAATHTMRFRFGEMDVAERWSSNEYPGEWEKRYHLRRRGDGTWQLRFQAETYERLRAKLLADDDPLGDLDDDLSELERLREWHDLPDHAAAVVQTHYDRFVRLP